MTSSTVDFIKVHIKRFVLVYWQFWARVLVRVRRPIVVGVTGSVGKTSTLAMLQAVLDHSEASEKLGWVHYTDSNMNDYIGLPMTVLLFDDFIYSSRQRLVASLVLPFRVLYLFVRYPKILVLEYGTSKKGRLPRLARLVPPDIAVVTTIGPSHLDGLKSVQGVFQEKSALVSAVPTSGLVVLGSEHEYVAQLEALSKAPVVKVGGRGLQLCEGIARAVGLHLGLSKKTIDAAIAGYRPRKGRLNFLQFDRLTLIDDSYNANPLSMRLGLDTLNERAGSARRRVAFLGTMAELGEDKVRFHDEIGRYAREKCDVIVGVGELARYYRPDFWFSTSDECAENLHELIHADDCVLVKGSASVKMSSVVEALSNWTGSRDRSRQSSEIV